MSAEGHAALWFTVVALGIYHGLNPAMGWPLAVASGMTARRGSAVFATLMPLGVGHLLAMAVAVLPFTLLSGLLQHGRAVRLGAGCLLLLFGAYRLVNRRHPRCLARIRPTQLTGWAFVMATAHGAGLMLVPVALGLCSTTARTAPSGALAHDALRMLPGVSDAATALLVALVHTLAVQVSGVAVAWLVYRWLGLQFVRRAWFNLDALWGAGLIVAGAVSGAMAIRLPVQ